MHQLQISGFVKNQRGLYIKTLFGYRSKGIPGLQILGMGEQGVLIKEKIIYLNKLYGLTVPNYRFQLCLDGGNLTKELLPSDKEWFELPLLFLFWSLAEIIPIRRLDNCFCSGKVSAKGFLCHYPLVKLVEKELEQLSKGRILTALDGEISREYFDTRKLCAGIRGIRFLDG